MFAGHPILEEIKQGIKLRPTKTIDKSKPLFKADGEDESSIDPKRRAPDGVPPAPVFAPPPPCTAPPPPPINFPPGAPPPPPPPGMNRAKSPGGFKLGGSTPAEVDRNALLKGIQGGVRLRKTVTNDKSGLVVDDELKQKSVKIHDPVPNAPPPPPPPMSAPSAPPPPPPANLTKPNTERAKSPRVFKLGGSTPAEVDRNALLQGIQGGFRLRKTVTNDKSGLVIDEDMLKSSFKRCEPTAPPPMPVPKAVPTITRNKSPNNLAVESSEDERYQTPDDRGAGSKYATPEPGDFSPPTPRRQTATPEPQAPKKIDYTFEEKNLKVTSEDLEKEIKKGTAAAKIAKFMQAESSAPGGSTLPKANFRRSPLRSTFLEVNNNQNDDSQKSKPVSKWAPVEVGGLKRPSQGNTPMEKIERAHSESRFPTRERSASALAEPVSTERARTQSPIGERERSSSTLPAPISIRTDFNDTSSKTTSSKRTVGKLVRPQIEETPPTPKTSTAHSHPYTFKPPRSVSPPEQPTSPISSISSASLPSPSSISPGSTSPEVVPRRRVNPAFDKAKEKFASAPTQPSTSAPAKTTKTLKPSTVESKNAATSPMPSPSVQKTEKKDPVKKTVKETQTSTKSVQKKAPAK